MKFRLTLAQIAVFMAFGASKLAGQTISDFTPTLGSPGDTITVNGSGFSASDRIYFFNGKLAVPMVPSTSQLTVVVPAGTTTGPIGIRVGTGTTVCGLGGFNCSSGDFTVVGPGPYITDVSPNLGATNDAVTISGVHFLGATSVKFNGTSASFTTDSFGTQIFLNVPVGATSGFITVTGPNGTGTSPSSFTVIGPGPYISGFSPAAGLSNTTVFINGRHFTGVTGVTFNGTNAASFAATADEQIQATTPMAVTTGPIKVTTSQGAYTSPTNFFVPPSVTSFSPGTGAPSASVTISGKNFTGATAVKVNGAAASYSVINNTSISATVPAGVNSGLVRVTAPAGTAFSSSNFRIQATLSGFSPNSGAAGTSVTINGANLNEGLSSVTFNGVSASFATPAFGSVVVTAPAATTGLISLTTTNGTVTTVNSFFFPPSITSFSPGTGSGGTPVSITGQNFAGATAVTFNGVAASSFFVNNNTSISATAPAGVSSGTIKVTAPAGTATSVGLFYAPPVITGFAPTHGVVGTTVTISGVNFLGASAVQFGGTNATSFSVANNNSIQAAVPSGAVTGPIKVIAPAGSYTTTTNFVLDYRSDLAVTITDTPDPVTVGSNLVYTVYVFNGGPDDAPNVFLTNYLPTSVTLKSAVADHGTLATNDFRTIVANMGTVFAFAQSSITLTVTPTNVGTIFDSANAVSGYVDPVATNSVASASTVVQPLPLLSIGRAASNQVKVSWAIALSNYSLQYKSDLPTNYLWVSNSTVPVLTNNQIIVTEPATNARRFYRLIR